MSLTSNTTYHNSLLTSIRRRKTKTTNRIRRTFRPLLYTNLQFLTIRHSSNKGSIKSLLQNMRLTYLLTKPNNRLTSRMFVNVTRHIGIHKRVHRTFNGPLSSNPRLNIPVNMNLTRLKKTRICLKRRTLRNTLRKFLLSMLRTYLRHIRRLHILNTDRINSTIPRIQQLSSMVRLTPRLLFGLKSIIEIIYVPGHRQRLTNITTNAKMVLTRLLLHHHLMVIQRMTRGRRKRRMITRVIHVRHPTRLINSTPRHFSRLLLVEFNRNFQHHLVLTSDT